MARATSLSMLLTRCTVLRTTSGVRVPSLVPCADGWAGLGQLSWPLCQAQWLFARRMLCCAAAVAAASSGCPLCVPAVLLLLAAGKGRVARCQPSALCLLLAVMRTGESGLTVFRLLTKDKRWKWVQANARLVYKNGKPEYIVVTQRPLVYVPGLGWLLPALRGALSRAGCWICRVRCLGFVCVCICVKACWL